MAVLKNVIPHVRQEGNGDCLICCAAMILAYHGKAVSRWRLKRLLGIIGNVGTPFSRIVRIEKYGVTVHHQKSNLAMLKQHIGNDWPCIVSVSTKELPYWSEETSHAVVVVGIDEKQVYLNDPFLDFAPVQVPIGEFDLAWLEGREMIAVVSAE